MTIKPTTVEPATVKPATIKPPHLRPGDTVGLFSPSSPCAAWFPHRLEQGIRALAHLGLKVKLGPNALLETGWTAGTPEQRASDLHALWDDPEVKAVIALIGGDHSNQMLPLIEYPRLAANPKVLLGYSDMTVPALAIHARTGLVTFYGPAVLPELGEYPAPLAYTVQYLQKALFQPDPVGLVAPAPAWTDEFLDWGQRKDTERRRRLQPNPGPRALYPGRAEGRLLGGCLSSLCHLRGTPYWPDWSGALFFWELWEEAPSPALVDSLLTDLENSGLFEQVSGMLVGRPYGYAPERRAAIDELVRRYAGRHRLPTLIDLDFGHTDPKFTLPIGVRASLNADACTFAILEHGVS